MKKVSIEIEGQLKEVSFERVGKTIWWHVEGETFSWTGEDRPQRKGNAQAVSQSPGVAVAPMPGKVVKIAVALGQAVDEGETLVVLEAMKMEYTLKADIDGVVKEVSCQEGNQVTLGQVLAVVEGVKEV